MRDGAVVDGDLAKRLVQSTLVPFLHDLKVAYGDVGITVRAVAGDGGQVFTRGHAGARAAKRDLSTLRVELRRVRLVECD